MSSSTPPPGFPPYSNPPMSMPSGGTPLGAAANPASGRPANPSAPTRRVVGLSRLLAIMFAGVALLAVGYITLADEQPGLYVARANMSLAEMTELNEGMVSVVSVPSQFLEPDAISGDSVETVQAEMARLYGQVTRFPIGAGQQLRFGLFTGETRSLSPVGESERLVSVPAAISNAVAGALRPGDRVDVIAVDPREGVAGVLAVNIEVVAVRLSADQLVGLSAEQVGPDGRELRPEDLQPAQPIPGLYTLRVDAPMAVTIAVASSEGELHLVYRRGGAVDAHSPAVSLLEAICLTTVAELRPLACQGLPLPEGGLDEEYLNDLFGGEADTGATDES